MCRLWRKPGHVSPSWLRAKSCGANRCTWMLERRPFNSETYRARWEQMMQWSARPVGCEWLNWRRWDLLCAWLRNAFDFCVYDNLKFDLLLQDELENYSFKSIYRCDAFNTEKHFPSLLMLICQSEDQKKPDILFFSCEAVRVSNNTWAASQHFPDWLSVSVWILSVVQV